MPPASPIVHPVLNMLLVALLGALATFLVQTILKHKDRLVALGATVSHTLDDHEQRLRTIELKLGFFWHSVEEHMADVLKRPTHFDMDRLLEKLRDHTITLDECYELRGWLEAVYLGQSVPGPAQHRLVAVLVLGAVNSLIIELEQALAQQELLAAAPEGHPRRPWRHRLAAWWHALWEV